MKKDIKINLYRVLKEINSSFDNKKKLPKKKGQVDV